MSVREHFWTPLLLDKPIILEIFTNDIEESDALKSICTIEVPPVTVKGLVKGIMGERGVKIAKKIMGK